MKDVAALAGVSLKTVSRVVNREPGVSPELVTKVEAAALELDYQPDLNASNLRRSDRRTLTIGLLLEDVTNEYSSALHGGVEDVAHEHGVAVLAASIHEDPVRERDLVAALAARRVDGLLIVPTAGEQDFLETEQSRGIAMVFIDRLPRGMNGTCVLTDNYEGAYEAVRHLLQLGHERIAFIGGYSDLVTAQDRYRGYLDAMVHADVPIDRAYIRRDVGSAHESENAIADMLSRELPPTAFFCAQNLITMGAVRALQHHGLQHRKALIGFDDFALADLLDPAVAVVAQDPRVIGQQAARLLFERMNDPNALSEPETHVVPSKLILRPSGEIRPE